MDVPKVVLGYYPFLETGRGGKDAAPKLCASAQFWSMQTGTLLASPGMAKDVLLPAIHVSQEKGVTMAYTISTHNGSQVSRQHNLRNPKVVSKQHHIRRDGVHETWIDKNPRQAYKELFGAAQETYNKKQIEVGRPERCIKSYYAAVENDAKKHTVYEMIAAIGSKYSPPPPDAAKEILRKFVDNWPDRNSSLELVGAYYHFDEDGVGHVHIDYIPVARGYRNGLEVQNGLVKALNAIGFETKSMRETAQIQWEHRENQYLEDLCRERNLDIIHPLEEGRKHIETELYKSQQELERTKAKLNANLGKLHRVQADHDYIASRRQKMLQEGYQRFEQYKSILEQQEAKIERYNAKIAMLENEIRLQKEIYKVFGGNPNTLPAAGGQMLQADDRDDLDERY